MVSPPSRARILIWLAVASATVVAFASAGCKGKDKANAGAATGSGSGLAQIAVGSGSDVGDVTATQPARPTGADTSTVEGLWSAYQAAHVGATIANVVETGRKVWPLLSPETQKVIRTNAAESTLQLAEKNIKLDLSVADLVYKLLGDAAFARTAIIRTATITEDVPLADADVGGRRVTRRKLTITAPGSEPLVFEVVRESATGPWLFGNSPTLLVDADKVLAAPAGEDRPAGVASPEALAARWTEILVAGSGWDACNLLSPATRKKMHDMGAAAGAPMEPADLAVVFERQFAVLRANGVTVTNTAIEGRTADHATLLISTSNGNRDTFGAVLVDGAWWLELK